MRKRLHWLLPTLFCAWVAISIVLLYFYGNRLPVAITNIFSLAYFIFFPLVPVFKHFGLTEGELFRGPTSLGIGIGMAIYSLGLFFIGKVIQRFINPAA